MLSGGRHIIISLGREIYLSGGLQITPIGFRRKPLLLTIDWPAAATRNNPMRSCSRCSLGVAAGNPSLLLICTTCFTNGECTTDARLERLVACMLTRVLSAESDGHLMFWGERLDINVINNCTQSFVIHVTVFSKMARKKKLMSFLFVLTFLSVGILQYYFRQQIQPIVADGYKHLVVNIFMTC